MTVFDDEQIYQVDRYIPNNILLCVEEAAQKLTNTTKKLVIKRWKRTYNPLGCRFIITRVMNMHPEIVADEDKKTRYLCCLQILAYLMKFHAGKYQAGKRKYLKAVDKDFMEWFRKTFVPEQKVFTMPRRLPAQVKDRILAYAVILAWHIDSNEFDLQTLAEGFFVTVKKLSTVVRALGGKTRTRQAGIKRLVAVLKI